MRGSSGLGTLLVSGWLGSGLIALAATLSFSASPATRAEEGAA
jgi:hypothetical protein